MLISDLKRPCTECDSSGFQAGFDEWGSIQTNLRQFCPGCTGKGYNLTELGDNLWKLYSPMIQDLIREEIQKKG
jgi:hypothetical protein|tara:strand:- start:535 stop:756 length:222 start_codon:yes stop_codon:yes gene_type:complete